MTRTAARLAELDLISRERSLTDAEAAEVKRLAHLERQCAVRRKRYASDPDYRRTYLERAEAWRRAIGRRTQADFLATHPRDERGRFA